MGIEDLWKKSRADRVKDPAIQASLDAERTRVLNSLGKLGNQAKETTSAILYNAVVRPHVAIKVGKKKWEYNPGKQVSDGAVDSTIQTVALVGRVLMSAGRVTKYGVRKALAI